MFDAERADGPRFVGDHVTRGLPGPAARLAPANELTFDRPADTCAEHEAARRPSEALRAAARAQVAALAPPGAMTYADAHADPFPAAFPRPLHRSRAEALGQNGQRREEDVSIPPASPDFDEHDAFFRDGAWSGRRGVHEGQAEHHEQRAGDHDRTRGRGAFRDDETAALDAATFYQAKPDLRLMQLASPVARERRARFEKYVKAAVGFSALLCIAAVARAHVARAHYDNAPVVLSAAHLEPLPLSGLAPSLPPPRAPLDYRSIPAPPPDLEAQALTETMIAETVITESNAADPVDPPSGSAPVAKNALPATPPAIPAPTVSPPLPSRASPPNGALAAAALASAAVDTRSVPPTKTAAQEKHDALSLLERYRAKDAISAAQRSVALDPTDGEAWLVLGAAYQEMGQLGDARKAFQACLKQGRRGPLSECRALLD